MDDLISRRAAVETLSNNMPSLMSPDGSHPADESIFHAQEAYVDAIELIKCLPSAQQWVPAGERLPLEYERVLLCSDGGYITSAQFIGGLFECDDPDLYGRVDDRKMVVADTLKVVAWMPLPEPYKEES